MSGGTASRDWGSKVPPTVREDRVGEHLRNLNMQKSMGPDELHPRVLGELIFLLLRQSLPPFRWCLLPLVLALGTTARSLAPSSSFLHQVFLHGGEAPPSIPFSRRSSPSSRSLPSCNRRSHPFLICRARCWPRPSTSTALSYWGAPDRSTEVRNPRKCLGPLAN